jgi:tetratricopeptide (TPR) repeat protein
MGTRRGLKALSGLVLSTAMSLEVVAFAGTLQAQTTNPNVVSKPAGRNGAIATEQSENQLVRAKALLGAGSLEEAISLIRSILNKDDQNAEAHLLLGSALALVPRRSEALIELRRAIELRPDSAPAYNTLGIALARFAEPQTARESFEKAIELDPQFVEPYVNLTLVLAQLKEFALAVDCISRAIELQGNSLAAAYSHFLKGRLHDEQDMPEKAAQEFTKAIELRPDYAEAYLELGTMRRKLQDSEGALKAFQKAVELAPNDPAARYRLGREYLQSGAALKAIEQLREAFRLAPDNRTVLYNLARALHEAGRAEEGKAVEEQLSHMLDSSTKATQNALLATNLNNAGVELEKEGNLAAAVEKYTEALELDPLHSGFRTNLGLALCRLGQWDQGIQELREAIRINPDDRNATRALYIALEKAEQAKEKASGAINQH